MIEGGNLRELAAMYHRLAASCETPDVVDKFNILANKNETAANRRSNGLQTNVLESAKLFFRNSRSR